jgi:hypothetical protein
MILNCSTVQQFIWPQQTDWPIAHTQLSFSD